MGAPLSLAEWNLHAETPLRLRARWQRAGDTSDGWTAALSGGNFVKASAVVAAYEQALAASTPLRVERMLAGAGDDEGAVLMRVRNTGGRELHVAAFDSFPWPLMVLWHTIRVSRNGTSVPLDTTLLDLHIVPTPLRGPPQQLAWRAALPAYSSLTVAVDFEKAMMHVDEVPADTWRGIEVGSAAVLYRDASLIHVTNADQLMFSNGALMPLAVGDLSMAYNVITITSTLVSLFVGSMFNLLTRSPRRF